MPFCYEVVAVYAASIDGLFEFLFLKPVVVNQTDRRFQSNLGLLSVTVHMHMDGRMLVQIKEEPQSK